MEREQIPAAAYMHAEGAMWLATGEVHRDEAHPMAAILDRLDAVAPLIGRYEWLSAARDELGDRSPLDLIDADDLEPLAEYLALQPALTSDADGDR